MKKKKCSWRKARETTNMDERHVTHRMTTLFLGHEDAVQITLGLESKRIDCAVLL